MPQQSHIRCSDVALARIRKVFGRVREVFETFPAALPARLRSEDVSVAVLLIKLRPLNSVKE